MPPKRLIQAWDSSQLSDLAKATPVLDRILDIFNPEPQRQQQSLPWKHRERVKDAIHASDSMMFKHVGTR